MWTIQNFEGANMVKINNNVPPGKPAETELMHGDFSSFPTNLATPQGGEIIPSENNKSMAADAMGIQDTNTKLLIKSLNEQLHETQPDERQSEKKAQFNPKEFSIDQLH